ncbi:acyl-CoA Delta(11) desaturase-like [Athalia rosae]|uniref:acyl-CoA Delta(11) desaturase-like n=1 Tax=Athalia rosae TaxID=37344 RepID=UPI00203336E2|nr:acyl-CoA Delta(11) desaturase-like [Athalia rosae]
MFTSTVTQFKESEVERKKSIRDGGVAAEVAAEPIPLPPQSAEQPLIWINIIVLAILHFVAFYGFATNYHRAKLWTWVFSPFYGITSGIGVTAGAHRLWAHRSYSAKTPLKIFLALLYCAAGQTSPFAWIRDHRTHHRYTETPADPHDANRGFFFSHVGWLMMRRHPAVKKYGSKVDMSDIYGDPVLQVINKYYTPLMLFLCFALPIFIPIYFWNESPVISILAVTIRYVWLLNATFLVNSFAHMWGNRPYDSRVKPTENATVSFFALGEGWHNYHHSFPWDYKAAELGSYGLNPSTAFIDCMAWLGLAYNLKSPSRDIVEQISLNKGDGTNSLWGNDHHSHHHHHHDNHHDHHKHDDSQYRKSIDLNHREEHQRIRSR